MDHIKLQFTTDRFQQILKTRIGVMEGLIKKASEDADKVKQAAAALGTTLQHGLMGHGHQSPVDGYRAEIERLTLLHDHLVPGETFTVTAAEALAVIYDARGGYIGGAYAFAG